MIVLVQAGYENVVASMGTALTQPQLRELRKLARNVVLLFDADTAGSEAALRGLELAAASIDLRVRVASPPRGSDPAEVAAAGREAVDRMLDERAERARLPRLARARRRGRRQRATAATRPTRRCRRSSATRRRRPSATSSCALAGSRLFLDPLIGVAPRRASARAGERAEARAGARAPADGRRASATSGCCWRSRSRPASAASATLERIPPEALTHDGLARCARLGARAAEPGSTYRP